MYVVSALILYLCHPCNAMPKTPLKCKVNIRISSNLCNRLCSSRASTSSPFMQWHRPMLIHRRQIKSRLSSSSLNNFHRTIFLDSLDSHLSLFILNQLNLLSDTEKSRCIGNLGLFGQAHPG